MKEYDYEEAPEIIDVPSYESVSQDELFRQAPHRQRTNAEGNAQLRAEVMRDPERCFCRNCGNPVLKAASVCVSCRYVLNPQAIQQSAMRIRERRAKYEKSRRVFQVINSITGIDLESDESKALFQETPQRYVYRTTGTVYCTNCGREVDPGASVCVKCKYVLNPQAVRRAQIAMLDKRAKMTAGLAVKSLLVPGFGRKQRKMWRERRPQIAKPCGTLGHINTLLLLATIFLTYFFFFT